MNLTEASQLINQSADDLKRSNDAHDTERRRYMLEMFQGGDDWINWLDEREAKHLTQEVAKLAYRADPEDALRQIMLLFSVKISEIAKRHAETCERNGWK